MRERGRAGASGAAARLWQAAPQRSPAARAAGTCDSRGRSGRGAAAGGVSQSPGDPAAGRKEKCLLCRNEPGLPPPVGFGVETRADSAPVRSAMPSPPSSPSPLPRLSLLARPGARGTEQKFPRRLSRIGSAPLIGVNPFAPPRSCHTPGPSFAVGPLCPFSAEGPALPHCSSRPRSGRGTGLVRRRRRPRAGGGVYCRDPRPNLFEAVPPGRAGPGGASGVSPGSTVSQPLTSFSEDRCTFSLRVSFFPVKGCEFHSSLRIQKGKMKGFYAVSFSATGVEILVPYEPYGKNPTLIHIRG